jgi:phosphoribosylformylglycinamidine cyclo-ligase
VLFRHYDELRHQLGEELLIRHRCYYPLLEPVLGLVKGLAHITGGGLSGKMPAILPDTVAANFQQGSWLTPPIFSIIQREGKVSHDEMRQVFNMGLGMVAVCEEEAVATLLDAVPDAQVVGQIVERRSSKQVCFDGCN